MTYCQMAGARCQSNDTVLIRIFGLGDRRICRLHLESLRGLGVDFRLVEEQAPVTWRRSGIAKALDRSAA